MSDIPPYFQTPHNQTKLAICLITKALVRSLDRIDPELQQRFIRELQIAYSEVRGDWATIDALEVVKWTAEMVVNDDYQWPIVGEGEPIVEQDLG